MTRMTAAEFTQRQRVRLLEILDGYLGGRVAHDDASACAWEIITDWEASGMPPETPLAAGEEVVWATVWALQHVADSEHWADGVTQRDLRRYVDLLRTGGELPPGETAQRPS